MVFPVYTAIAAATLTLILMVLGFYTVSARRSESTSLGFKKGSTLEKRVRAHANLAEYGPLILISLGLIEISVGRSMVVAGLAAWLIIARTLHPIGLITKTGANAFRFIGAASTFLIGIIVGIWLLIIAVKYLN